MNKVINFTTHCQICARPIKANTGRIAHHGYTRPGWGWQSASCEGAKQLPYEVSRDYIPVVIKSYELAAANQTDLADQMLREPADTITRRARSSYEDDHTYDKPADFDATAAINASYNYDQYAREFARQYKEHRAYARDIAETIVYLQKRYDEWAAKI